MTLEEYISKINQRFQLGNSTEHTFRGDLQTLLESIVPKVSATNEPKRIACGAPDFVLTKKDIPIGFIEAKNIGDKDLEGKKKTGNKSQFDRYKNSLGNLAFTDYLDFHFYEDKKFIKSIAIGKIENGQIEPIRENFESFTRHINDFCIYEGQTIKSPKKLAEMMAAKAQMLADVIENSLDSDEKEREDSSLKEQFEAFKQILIKDISHKAFADVYAQTIAYGMFAARLHDNSPNTFTRKKAAELIPKSNPFLRKLFQYIAGFDLDERLVWIVDSLSDIFVYSNVEATLKEYGRETQTEDALIHFYETFLAEYDPKLRKARGVWYTPKPVVNFIVRAVDDILKTEFNLPKGLIDSSKTKIKISEKGNLVEKEVHKVQILDPATGTGTFLAETVEHIYKQFQNQKGVWNSYVENDLLPRLNGFELLMASYAMAHLKLDFLLKETGFKPTKEERFRVFLTNSLEEGSTELESSFANWLSTEANEANKIKKDTPIMVILGNPPYAVSSSNKSNWIQNLIADYKKDLKERKINLDDDYIKFIRFGQHFIDKNESGVLAYISNNSFIDGITHRQMRKHLLKSFDKIYVLDLHGNAKKKEVCPDGSPDKNVFDIMQGVSINIFVKTGKKKKDELGQILHYDLQGKREFKYNFLEENNLNSLKWNKLKFTKPYYFFTPKDFSNKTEYNKGLKINELFIEGVAGIETIRDAITIHFTSNELSKVINDFATLETDKIAIKYKTKDSRDWKIQRAKEDVEKHIDKSEAYQNIAYRPFDKRKTFYTGKQNGFVCNGRYNVMKHLLRENLGCIIKRGFNEENAAPVFLTKFIVDRRGWSRPGMQGAETIYPLYTYNTINSKIEKDEKIKDLEFRDEENQLLLEGNIKLFQKIEKMYKSVSNPSAEISKEYSFLNKHVKKLKENATKIREELNQYKNNSLFGEQEEEPRKPNLKKEIVAQIAQKLGLVFTVEKTKKKGTFAPIDILDYIYAVLHSPKYREKYKEFLKIDFPRVPYPADAKTFWKLVDLGGQIRQIHLLESDVVNNFITSYPVEGKNEVEQRPNFNLDKKTQLGKVYINENQYFDNVPATAWEFYIGGYQPAQKWLKDRKGRELSFEEINHYQKIIVALSETDKLMKKIDIILN
ncbi:putative helicase [Bernardetia litoralis DSM 6794]|uniref:site-specific DNA-methyltransferase (adenine-specific) n=1 Tax=Bernardetia litoralis (strain ATCC 23117 / DSM 6794 / NBRC 15988 / NCIMB 1366 / Fx l1 / Sio-4) TaxID=880071 RepID=I4APS5_BERLS|nr:type ISP restriction/modification enzyme [Bernardetia litoralis]AFM05960.1 putative helicase [Bernardetia litoralis DSM 6794]